MCVYKYSPCMSIKMHPSYSVNLKRLEDLHMHHMTANSADRISPLLLHHPPTSTQASKQANQSTNMSTPNTNTNTNTNPPSQPPETTKEAHHAFTTSLKTISSNHDAALQERAHTLQSNAGALDAQEASLRQTTADLAAQNEGIAGLVGEAGAGLKEIGDVQNWAEVMERELLVLEETIGGVEKGDGVGEAEGEGEGEMNGKNGKKDGQRGKRGWMRWW
jgi:hypothetical protein